MKIWVKLYIKKLYMKKQQYISKVVNLINFFSLFRGGLSIRWGLKPP